MNFMRILRHPRAAVITHDLVMVAASWLAAAWIINQGGISGIIESLPLFTELFLVLLVQGLVLWATGLYKGLWRFASFPDLWNIARAAAIGTIIIIEFQSNEKTPLTELLRLPENLLGVFN